MTNATNGQKATGQGLIVKLSTRKWSGRKADKQLSAEVEASKGACGGVLSTSKKLVDDHALYNVNAIARSARETHLQYTRYWDDSGSRLLPAGNVANYRRDMDNLIATYDDYAEKLVGEIDQHIEEAQKRLGGVFDPADYPNKEKLRKQFSMSVEYTPIPDGKFIPMDIEGRDQLVEIVEQQTRDKLTEGTRQLFYHLREALVNMRKNVERFTETGETGSFYQSTVDAVVEISSYLPELNITHDPYLERAVEIIQRDFAGLDRNLLRSDPEKARKVADQVSSLLESLPGEE